MAPLSGLLIDVPCLTQGVEDVLRKNLQKKGETNKLE